MEQAVFNQFQTLVYEKSGITLGPQKVALVSARIGKRMRALGIEDHKSYLKYVTSEDTQNEIVHMLDAISTNVTSFFRESVHFDFLYSALKKWLEEGQQTFRIWCAAASTGEEPYCLAMICQEALGNKQCDVRILATDISTRVLEVCRQGEYGKSKLDPVPPAMRKKYFQTQGKGEERQYIVSPELRKLISFNRLNLSTPPFPMKGPMDVVFCRNVMIYFDAAVRTHLVREIHRLLKPGGYLMIGHSESLTGIDVPFRAIQSAIHVKV